MPITQVSKCPQLRWISIMIVFRESWRTSAVQQGKIGEDTRLTNIPFQSAGCADSRGQIPVEHWRSRAHSVYSLFPNSNRTQNYESSRLESHHLVAATPTASRGPDHPNASMCFSIHPRGHGQIPSRLWRLYLVEHTKCSTQNRPLLALLLHPHWRQKRLWYQSGS